MFSSNTCSLFGSAHFILRNERLGCQSGRVCSHRPSNSPNRWMYTAFNLGEHFTQIIKNTINKYSVNPIMFNTLNCQALWYLLSVLRFLCCSIIIPLLRYSFRHAITVSTDLVANTITCFFFSTWTITLIHANTNSITHSSSSSGESMQESSTVRKQFQQELTRVKVPKNLQVFAVKYIQ